MNFCIAVLLVLRLLPGNAEAEDDEEEMAQFLYDYASRYSEYLYSTEDYYYDNTTVIPTMYTYDLDSYETSTIDWENWFQEENDTTKISGTTDILDAPEDSRDAKDSQDSQESLGSSLRCHLTLTVLLSLLGLLL